MQSDNTASVTETPVLEQPAVVPGPAGPAPAKKNGFDLFEWLPGSSTLFVLGFLPLALAFFINLWDKERYQFFPLAMAGAGVLVYTRLKRVPVPYRQGEAGVTFMLTALAFLMLAGATLLWSPWVGILSVLMGLAALAWWVGGYRMLLAMLPAGILLLTFIPPPLNLDERLTLKLRGLAVQGSSRVLDMLDIMHAVEGNVIELADQRLMVEEACSGINSVLSTTAVCLFYVMWQRRAVWQVALSLATTLSFVLLGNVARITVGAYAKVHYQVDLFTGWRHETVGLILFASYLILIVSFDQLVTFFVENPARSGPPEQEKVPVKETLAARFSSSLSWKLGFVCVLLGLAGIGRWVVYAQTMGGGSAASLSAKATFSMPEQIGDWKRLSAGAPSYHRVETRGVSSQSWHYQWGSLVASVALDYPFNGWYDLTVCYSGQGWKMGDVRTHGPSADHQPYTEAHMIKDSSRFGSVWFALVDERGRWVEAPSTRRNVLDRLRINNAAPATYRVQVFITDSKPLDGSSRGQALSFFEGARKMLAQQVLSQLEK